MADGRSTLLTQHTSLLTASALTPWLSVKAKLAMAVAVAVATLSGSNDVLNYGSKALREQLNVDVMDE